MPCGQAAMGVRLRRMCGGRSLQYIPSNRTRQDVWPHCLVSVTDRLELGACVAPVGNVVPIFAGVRGGDLLPPSSLDGVISGCWRGGSRVEVDGRWRERGFFKPCSRYVEAWIESVERDCRRQDVSSRESNRPVQGRVPPGAVCMGAYHMLSGGVSRVLAR